MSKDRFENRKKLYDALSQEYDLGTFEQFSNDIQNEEKRKKLYDATSKEYDYGDFDSFSDQLGFAPRSVQEAREEDPFKALEAAGERYEEVPPMETPANSVQQSQSVPEELSPEENAVLSSVAERMADRVAETTAGFNENAETAKEYTENAGLFGGSAVTSDYRYNPETKKLERTYITPQGTRTTNEHEAEVAAFNYRQRAADITTTRILSQTRTRQRDLLERKQARIKELSEQIEEQFAGKGGPLIADSKARIQQSLFANDPIIRALDVALHQTDEDIKDLQEQRDRENDKNPGFWRGFGRVVGDIRTWDSGITDLRDMSTQLSATRRLNDEDISDEEREAYDKMFESLYMRQQIQGMYGGNAGFMYRAGTMMGHMPAFMLQFGITGGGFSAMNIFGRGASKVAAKAFGKEAVEKMASTGIKDYVKAEGAKGIGRLAGNWLIKATGETADALIVRAPIMANTVQFGSTMADIIDRRLGDVKVNEDGTYGFSLDESWARAFRQGEMNAIIEDASEMLGGGGGKKILSLDNLSALSNAIGAKKLGAVFSKLKGSDIAVVADNMGKLFNRLGISDYTGEVFEEYWGQAARTIFGVDDAYKMVDGERVNLFATGEFHGDIWGGMALSMGLMNGARYGFTGATYISAKNGVSRADAKASAIFGDNAWETLKHTLDNTTNDDMGRMVAAIMSDKTLTAEEKNATLDYISKSMYFRGFNLGSVAQARDTEPGERTDMEDETEQSYMDGYESVSKDDMSLIRAYYDLQRQKMKMFVGTDDASLDGIDDGTWMNEAQTAKALGTEAGDRRAKTIMDFLNAKKCNEGMMRRVGDDIEDKIAYSDADVDSFTNKEWGLLIEVTLKSDKSKAFVVKGYIATVEGSTDIDESFSDESVIVRVLRTGELRQLSPSDILSQDGWTKPSVVKEERARRIRSEAEAAAQANISGAATFNEGDQYTVPRADGTPTPITIVPNEQGVIDNGDGTVNVTDGNNVFPMEKAFIQQQVDAQRNERVAEFESQREADNALAEEEDKKRRIREIEYKQGRRIAVADGDSVREGIVDYVNGGEVEIAFEDENGKYSVGMYTKDELADNLVAYDGVTYRTVGQESLLEEELPAGEPVETPQQPVQTEVEEPIESEAAAEEAQTEETQVVTEIPKDKKGRLQYHLTTPEVALAEMHSRNLSVGEISAFVDANIAEARKDLKNAEKRRPQMGTDLDAYAAEKAQFEEEIAGLRQRLSWWEQTKAVRDALYAQFPRVYTAEEITAGIEEFDTTPMTAEEIAAEILSSKDIKLNIDSFERETGYSRGEWRRFPGMFVRKGGLTIGELAELVESRSKELSGQTAIMAEVEGEVGFALDINDPNAARNAILELFRSVKKRGDINNYIRDNRREEKKRQEEYLYGQYEHDFHEEFGMSPEEYEVYRDVAVTEIINASLVPQETINAIFADEYNTYGNETVDTRAEETPRTDDTGTIQGNDQGTVRGTREGGDPVLYQVPSDNGGGTGPVSQGGTEVPGNADIQDGRVQGAASGTGGESAVTQSELEKGQERLNEEEAEELLSLMENAAEVAPEMELTIENWDAEFGEDGIVSTPIGEVKMGENQYLKLLRKNRGSYLGMIKPTLVSPDIILEESDPQEGAERDSKYLFIKTFARPDGSRYVHFESVTVKKDNLEVSISSHEIDKSALKRKMHQDKLVHLNEKFSGSEGRLTEPQSEGPDLVPTPNFASSESKDSNNSANTNELGEKVAAAEAEVEQNPTEGQSEEAPSTAPDAASETNRRIAELIAEYEQRVREWRENDYKGEFLSNPELAPALRELSDEELGQLLKEHQNEDAERLIGREINRRREQRSLAAAFENTLQTQGTIPSVAAPKKKFNISSFCGRDKQRPVLMGVYHDPSGYAVATDAFSLIADKKSYDPKKKGKIVGKEEIEGKYPRWESTIPEDMGTPVPLDIDALASFVAGAKAKAKEDGASLKDVYIMLRMPGGEIAPLNIGVAEKFVAGMRQIGATEMSFNTAKYRVMARSKQGIVLGSMAIFPERIPDSYRLYAYDLSGESQQDLQDKPRFQITSPAEESRELIAVHNISEDNLRKADELGGFPMPSIAITKAETGHTDFGEISLIFGKDTINPTDRRNKVYEGDAWTPVFPKIEGKLSDKAAKRIREWLKSIPGIDAFRRDMHIETANMEVALSRAEYNPAAAYANKDYMKYAYLQEQGRAPEIPTRKRNFGKYADAVLGVIRESGLNPADVAGMSSAIFFDREVPQEYEGLKERILNTIADRYNAPIRAAAASTKNERRRQAYERRVIAPEQVEFAEFDNAISSAVKLSQAEERGLVEETDSYALWSILKDLVDINDAQYRKWINERFDGIIEKFGIDNGQGPFRRDGSSRTWEQQYDKVTLENVVKAMKRQSATGGGILGNIFGAAQGEYETISEIREAARKKLRNATDEEINATKQDIDARNDEINIPGAGTNFGDIMDMKQNIIDAVRHSHTAKGIYTYLKEFYPQMTMDIAKEIEGIVKDIQAMPARYFEAKPQRAVGFDEVRLAVVPDNISDDVRKILEDRGIRVETYEHGNEEDRKRVVNAASEELRFQVGENAVQPMTPDQQLAFDAVTYMLDKAALPVEAVSNEEMERMREMSEARLKNEKSAPETASPSQTAHPTVVSSADGVKILNNLRNLAKEYEEKSNRPKTFIGDVAAAIKASAHGSRSEYATFDTINGKTITIRLSNHNAKVSNFDNKGEDEGISIIVSNNPNGQIINDGNAHVVEYYYNDRDLRRAEGKPLAQIIRSIEQALYSGEYKDTTGLAQREEVNGINLLINDRAQLFRNGKGIVYGAAMNGKIYLNASTLNPETPIHEYTHLWDEACRRINPELWNRGVELMKQTSLWNKVKNDPNYADLTTDDEIASEVHARLTGKDGAKLLERLAREAREAKGGIFNVAEKITLVERLKQWLSEFWYWVKDTMTPWSAEEARRVSLEDFVSMPVADLAKGTYISTASGLMAVHNISTEGLMRADRLGGFPMPSIAVTRPNIGHTDFGEISLIFGEETIDPAKEGNEVYGGDAYTMTFPKTGKLVSRDSFEEMKGRLADMFREDGIEEFAENVEDLDGTAMEESLLDNDNSPSRAFAFRNGYDFLKYAFLKETGRAPDLSGELNEDGYFNHGAYLTENRYPSINEALKGHEEEYGKWVDNLFNGVTEEVIITSEGEIAEYTLENVLDAMKEADYETGGARVFIAAAKTGYGSLNEIREDSGKRMRPRDEKKFEEDIRAIDEKLDGINLGEESQHLIKKWNITEAIRNNQSVEGIYSYLKELYPDDMTMEKAEKIDSLRKEAREIPERYFEAKPRRAVGFDEVRAAVVPDNADPKVLDLLESKGIRVVAYEHGNENSRKRAEEIASNGVRFQIGRARREQMRQQLSTKLANASEQQVENTIAEIEKLGEQSKAGGDPKLEKAATHWAAKGTVILPEDNEKIIQAVKVSEAKKVDFAQYNSPMELINSFPDYSPKEKPIDPDTVSTLSNKQELSNGITIYDVEESEESRENMRKIINTHLGKKRSPWCLLQGDGNGNLTEDSKNYWQHYNKFGKKVAFKDGKLIAFFASDSTPTWWDTTDRPHYEGVPAEIKIPGDALGRSGTVEIKEDGTFNMPEVIYRGNEHDGLYEKWSTETGALIYRVNRKNWRKEGTEERWNKSGKLIQRENYKNGLLDGYMEKWYEGYYSRILFENGDWKAETMWHDNGQLAQYADEKTGTYVSWNRDGVIDGFNFRDKYQNKARWYINGFLNSFEAYGADGGHRINVSASFYENGKVNSIDIGPGYKNDEGTYFFKKGIDGPVKLLIKPDGSEEKRVEIHWWSGEISRIATGRAVEYDSIDELVAQCLDVIDKKGREILADAEALKEMVEERVSEMDIPDNIPEEYARYGITTEENETGTNEEEADDLFRFIGEKGAANLDAAEEATTRLDNLAVARQMEESGKDAKAIKLATGWERGADGKWRYETPDFKVKDNPMLVTGEGYQYTLLNELIDDEGLFKAYPQLDGMTVQFQSLPLGTLAHYSPRWNMITIDMMFLRNRENPEWKAKKEELERQPVIKRWIESMESDNPEDFERIDDEVRKTAEWKELNDLLEGKTGPRRYIDAFEGGSELAHEIQHAIQDIEGFAPGGNEEQFINEQTERIAELNDRKEAIEEEISNGDNSHEEELQEIEIEPFDLTQDAPYHKYRRLAGEVESRNVEKRMNMTPEQRRQSLAEETEDVAREDQIFLEESLGASRAMASEDSSLEQVNERFNEQLEKWGDGKLPASEYVRVGNPMGVLRHFMPSVPIIVRQKVLTKSRKKHGLQASDMRDLPKALANPIFVFKSKPDTISVLTELMDSKGENIFVAIELGTSKQLGHQTIEVNDILTIHGREVENIVEPIISNDSLVWADKEKGLNWLSSAKSKSQAIANKVLDSATKVVENFVNPKLPEEERAMASENSALEQVNARFNDELQQQVEGKLPTGHIYRLGQPGAILRSTGFPNLPIELSSTRLAEKSNGLGHDFAIEDVKNLVKALNNPLAIFAYGNKAKAQNVIVELQKDGKNFIVGVHFNQNRGGLTINSIRGLFPKDNAEWLNWIEQDKLLRVDKKRILDLIDKQRTILADVTYLDLDSITKKVKNFVNPKLPEEEQARIADNAFTPTTREGREQMSDAVRNLAGNLHLGNVDVVMSKKGLSGKRAKAKGFFDRRTGRITIVVPNNANVEDAVQTLLHEAVAHYGLRQLFGDEFNSFLDNVFENVDEPIRRRIVEMAAKRDWDFRTATEEYLASLAENTNFEEVRQAPWWQRIKYFFMDMLRKLGYRGASISDNELRYFLWKSYDNLRNNGRSNIFSVAEDISLQQELGVGEYGDLYRDGDPVIKTPVEARDIYERRVRSSFYQTQEAMQDSMLGLHEFMRAVTEAEGKDFRVENIPDYENAYFGENRLSSVNEKEVEAFNRTLFEPFEKAIASLAHSEEERIQLTDYMMAKHGLERNLYMANQDAKAAFEEYQKNTPKGTNTLDDFIKKFRSRDYAGLTALTSKSSVTDAEAEARTMVADYEASHDVTDLWEKKKAVTDAILSKQLESGLMSQETYDQVRSMYEYYIPLQGFDETTGEDVYAYLTSNGGELFAPIKKARGRSSKADDPIATLAQRAESTISLGNRNALVKRRFFNFVLNHPSDLASVSELWLAYDKISDSWIPVFPDNIDENESAESVEQKLKNFEAKMESLKAAEPDMYKHGVETANIPYRVTERGDKREHQVMVQRFGRTYIITVNGNPRAAQAVNGATNPDSRIHGAIGRVIDMCGTVNRSLSAVYTTLQPDFIASNFIRDCLYSNIMAWVKEDPKYAATFNWNYARLNPASMFRLFEKYHNGTLNLSNRQEYLFKEFLDNGGETGYARMTDLEEQKKKVARMLKKMNQRIPAGQAADALLRWGNEVGRAIENHARFAAYITSRELGREIGRSIYDAKEISVNFNKKGAGDRFLGSKGQTFLGNTSSAISGLGRTGYIFWNAAIQGTFGNFAKNAKRNPGKTMVVMATFFSLGLLITALGAAGGDDDDEAGNYYDIPETVRRKNLVIKGTGKTWIKIPLPIEFRAVYGMGELCGATVFNGEPLTPHKVLEQFSQLTPIDIMSGQNLDEGGKFKPLVPFIPSSLKTIYEMSGNVSWTGLPIYNDTPWNQNMPNWTKAYKNANSQIVDLCETLNEWSGGDEYTKGKVDLNPALIEYALRGYAGGLWTFTDQLVKLGETAMGKRDFDWRSVPLANRFLTTADERTEYRAINNTYYRNKQKHDVISERLRKYEADTQDGIRDYSDKIEEILNGPDFIVFSVMDDFIPDVNSIASERKEIIRFEDEAYLEEVEKALAEVKKAANEAVKAELEAYKKNTEGSAEN